MTPGHTFQAFFVVPLAPCSVTLYCEDMNTDKETAKAARLVTAWLEDDERLCIPDTEWGGELYDAIRLLAAAQR